MKLRVIEVQTKGLNVEDREKAVTHYIPQYFDEREGWSECHLSENLCAHYYYKQKDAIDVCMKYAKKYEPNVVWSEDTGGIAGNPWRNCHDTQPPHDCRVLLAVNDESEEGWYYIPAYWRDGIYFSGYNAVHPVDVYKYAYWRYIDAPQIKEDSSLKVEDIVDRYVKTATPELRQQLIDKLTEIRKEKFGIE